MAPGHLAVYSFEAYRYLLAAGTTLVHLILERDIVESLAIIEEHEIGLTRLYLFDTTSVQTIISPGTFINAAIVDAEDARSISLPFLMLAHVPVQFVIQ